MIFLDLNSPVNDIYLNICGLSDLGAPAYSMKLFSSFDNSEVSFGLGSNVGKYPSRVYEFAVSSSLFSGSAEGLYTYKVYDTVDQSSQPIEIGLARLINTGNTGTEILSISKSESEDNLITYSS